MARALIAFFLINSAADCGAWLVHHKLFYGLVLMMLLLGVQSQVLLLSASCRVGKQVVNIPSFMVRVDSQKHIDFALTSPFGGGRPGRVKRKSMA